MLENLITFDNFSKCNLKDNLTKQIERNRSEGLHALNSDLLKEILLQIVSVNKLIGDHEIGTKLLKKLISLSDIAFNYHKPKKWYDMYSLGLLNTDKYYFDSIVGNILELLEVIKTQKPCQYGVEKCTCR